MADILISAKVKPEPGTRTLLYTAAGPCVLSSLRACNLGDITEKVRFARAFGGEPEDDSQYLVYDAPVPPGWPYSVTEGIVLAGGDSIYVQSLRGTTAFNLSGAQAG